MYPQKNKKPPVVRTILAQVSLREDQTMIHIATMYITLILVQVGAVLLLLNR
ncbi:MAG TPA: hypothetical protein VK826_19300 [Bacteroidia bacterium]|nr:hypothetical protein [Bacteroidia bacterium]